jgi:hypothetical protein
VKKVLNAIMIIVALGALISITVNNVYSMVSNKRYLETLEESIESSDKLDESNRELGALLRISNELIKQSEAN